MELNKDVATRDNIVKPFVIREGSLNYFEGMPAEVLKQLVDLQFADPEERQNNAPDIADMLLFLEDNPKFTAHGYTVPIGRKDYRISVEGVECKERLSSEEIEKFVNTFREADDFVCNSSEPKFLAWFD